MGAVCNSGKTQRQREILEREKLEAEQIQRLETEALNKQINKFEEIRDSIHQLELDKLNAGITQITEEDMERLAAVISVEKDDPELVKFLFSVQNSSINNDQDIIMTFKTFSVRHQNYLIDYLKVVIKLLDLNKDLQDFRTKYWFDVFNKYKSYQQAPVTQTLPPSQHPDPENKTSHNDKQNHQELPSSQ